ncbi:MAG: hypothetical protein DRI79_07895 [Chloroflexi bacterium]|nr:MAG: hypothetical protein DRI79_07895 [Chloroflexota bacterium]
MLKSLLSWLQQLLGLGTPAILSFSSVLPGIGGDEDQIRFVFSSPTEALRWRLARAQAFLEVPDVQKAKNELIKADRLSLQLRPHTPQHEHLVQLKTHLWQQVNSFEAEL